MLLSVSALRTYESVVKLVQGSRTPARLPAAVEEWLKAAQIPFCAPEPGVLELTL